MTKINSNIPYAPIVGIAPVLNEQTHTLILCAFPDRFSLEQKQYYANQHQLFWSIMSFVLQLPFSELTYSQKIDLLLKTGYGLWDVISFYEHIRSHNVTLKSHYPHLKRIVFNGKVAARYQKKINAFSYETIVLPSTHGLFSKQTLQKKIIAWSSLA